MEANSYSTLEACSVCPKAEPADSGLPSPERQLFVLWYQKNIPCLTPERNSPECTPCLERSTSRLPSAAMHLLVTNTDSPGRQCKHGDKGYQPQRGSTGSKHHSQATVASCMNRLSLLASIIDPRQGGNSHSRAVGSWHLPKPCLHTQPQPTPFTDSQIWVSRFTQSFLTFGAGQAISLVVGSLSIHCPVFLHQNLSLCCGVRRLSILRNVVLWACFSLEMRYGLSLSHEGL